MEETRDGSARAARDERGDDMSNSLRGALDYATACEKKVELLYKGWEQHAPTAQAKSLLAEMGATERGHHEMLLHISATELVPRRGRPAVGPEVAQFLVDVPSLHGPLTCEAVAAAVRQEEALVALYKFLAGLGGETAQLFRALTAEEKRHVALLLSDVDPAARTLAAGSGVHPS